MDRWHATFPGLRHLWWDAQTTASTA